MKISVKHLPIFLAAVAAGTVAGVSAWRFAIYGKLNYAKLLGELRYDAGYLDSLYGRDYAGGSRVIAEICRQKRVEQELLAEREARISATRYQMADDLAKARESGRGPKEDW